MSSAVSKAERGCGGLTLGSRFGVVVLPIGAT